MKVPFVNPLTAILLFVQSLLFFLRYNGDSNLKEAHWGIMLIPTFIAEIFLVIMLFLPIKILLRLVLRIKYVWVTPWFNV